MIDFNENDFNLVKVKQTSKLFNLVTRLKYRVYGLRQKDNPAILVEFNGDMIDVEFLKRIESLKIFVKANGIEFETYNASEFNRVDIGLRKDLRSFVTKNGEPMLASSILQTIIYCLEGRIDLEQLKKFKLSAIPRLIPADA